MADDIATIGHNSSGVMDILDRDPSAFFAEPDLIDDLLKETRKKVERTPVNLETARVYFHLQQLEQGVAA